MKKLTLLLFVVILLTACQPNATPDSTPEPTATLEPTLEPTATPEPILEPTSGLVEALASSTSDLVGVWWFPQRAAMIEFKDDGTCRVFSGSKNIGQIDSGSFTFDAGKVNFIPGGTPSDACKNPATYQAYITTQDGNPVSIRMQVVGSDSCSGRVDLLNFPGKFYNP